MKHHPLFNPRDIVTGEGLVRALKKYGRTIGVKDAVTCVTSWYSPFDWLPVADAVFTDRVQLMHKATREMYDITGHRLLSDSNESLFEPINVPPAYREMPIGFRLVEDATSFPVGTRFKLLSDRLYFMDLKKAGEVVVFEGYRTYRELIAGRTWMICFQPVVRFEDGTFRHFFYTPEVYQIIEENPTGPTGQLNQEISDYVI